MSATQPQVVLIGDSIRMGYQPFVEQELESIASVWAPGDNCAHTVHTLINFQDWVLKRKPDLLHLNNGLHDVKTLHRDTRENLVPLSVYQRNLDTMFWLVRNRLPETKIIWATITPVGTDYNQITAEAGHIFCRHNEDIEAYNAVGREVCAKYGVSVNDLWSVVQAAGPASLQTEDKIHYTEAGSEHLGKHVAAVIREALGA